MDKVYTFWSHLYIKYGDEWIQVSVLTSSCTIYLNKLENFISYQVLINKLYILSE